MTFNQLIEHRITCPYCSECFTVLIDGSEPQQEYVEDCHVCCQPMVLSVGLADDGVLLGLQLRREND
ncbi:MAG: CPXCG motif-containing cysteine-rich protein [Halopseudomonas sp.]